MCDSQRTVGLEAQVAALQRRVAELEAEVADLREQVERAWAAGFFDGEGCSSVHIQKRGPWVYASAVMSIVQTKSPELLERFGRAVGVGVVGGPFLRKNPKHAPIWRWVASGNRLCTIAFAAIQPHVGTVKLAQHESMVAKVAAGKRSLKGRPVSPEHRERLQALAEARRGIPLSDETRAKLSAARMGHAVSESTRTAVAAANRGRIVSAETREKMRASALKRNRKK